MNVQVLVLLPPLEHAPDQTASRPLETLNVMLVPTGNAAVAVVPTEATIPDGVELTLSPWRPPAVTLRLTVDGAGAGGFRVSVADRVTPPPETEMVTSVCVLTWLVLIVKPPCRLPAGISTVLGRVTAGLLLLNEKIWSVVAAEATVTVPNDPAVPVTEVGLSDSEAGCPCGVRVICVCTLWPL